MNQQHNQQPGHPVMPRPGLESWSYVAELKSKWQSPPDSMKVMEFFGTGDPFFGGDACDLILDKSCHLVEEWKVASENIASFKTIEAAYKAAQRIPNRRPGSILGVIPSWDAPRKPAAQRCPRLLKALSSQCLLTPLEALSVLNRQEPEAVRHLGGWEKAVQAAWHSRHR